MVPFFKYTRAKLSYVPIPSCHMYLCQVVICTYVNLAYLSYLSFFLFCGISFTVVGRKKMSEEKVYYLYNFPLETTKSIRTLSGLKCFQLIWLKCSFNHSLSNISITKKDRNLILLPWRSYVRGLSDLENNLITVDRKIGLSCRITLNVEKIDQKAKSFIMNSKT